MSWGKLDDSFYDHPKIVAVGPIAAALWAASIGYCARHLTDGFVPERVAPILVNFQGFKECDNPVTFEYLQDLLLRERLWESADGGFLVHDYLDHNPPKIRVLEERGKAACRMRKGRSPEVRPKFARSSASPSPSPEEVKIKAGTKTALSTPELWITPEQKAKLIPLCADLARLYPKDYRDLERILAYQRRIKAPVEPLIQAFESALKHRPDGPGAYISKILKIEVQNWHESTAIAEHEKHKGDATVIGDVLAQMARKGQTPREVDGNRGRLNAKA